MFLHGFSAGAQFVHRFAFGNARIVCGVSAHSAGSWATRGYGEISSSARKIPFAISCGEKDKAKSFGSAPLSRIDWFKEFRDALVKKKFDVEAEVIKGVGHRRSPRVGKMATTCYERAKKVFGR